MSKVTMRLFLSLVLVFFTACGGYGPPEEKISTSYEQPFMARLAFMVIERGGKPYIMASGSLENKQEGLFSTAKHFTVHLEGMRKDSFKLFFNGKVYDAALARVSHLHDATLVRIISSFSPDDFPEPLPITKERPEIGDKIYIMGFHPHPRWVREANEKEGFPDTTVGVLTDYYNEMMLDPRKETQIVYDVLEGEVIAHDPDPLVPEMREYENESFIKVRMARNHKFSFGGLSGGMAATGQNGEVAGIITAQDIYRFEYDEHGRFVDPANDVDIIFIEGQLFDTVYVAPAESVMDLYQYARQ